MVVGCSPWGVGTSIITLQHHSGSAIAIPQLFKKSTPDLHRCKSVRVHPCAHSQHIKVLKLFIYMYYGCGMQSTGVLSLNHDITTSLGLAHTPIFQKWSPPGLQWLGNITRGWLCTVNNTKWNKDNKSVWRMDLPVDIEDTYDDRCEDEINKKDYQVDTGNRKSKGSMSVSSNLSMVRSFFKI